MLGGGDGGDATVATMRALRPSCDMREADTFPVVACTLAATAAAPPAPCVVCSTSCTTASRRVTVVEVIVAAAGITIVTKAAVVDPLTTPGFVMLNTV
jgi:hypothetical protein